MIHVFRKEMKKWHIVLWIVFVSMALSGVSFLFFRPKHWTEIVVAKVNGINVYFDQYRRSLSHIQERINSLRPLAQAYGMSEEAFLSTFLGVTKPEELAIDTCVRESLIDGIKNKFKITLNDDWFKNQLVKSMPQFIDQSGVINMDMYQRYLQQISTTPAEYEKNRMEDFKRDSVNYIIKSTGYVPSFIVKDIFESEHGVKHFTIGTFTLENFLHEVKKEALDENRLAEYYQANKEVYRVEEKRKVRYWTIDANVYAEKIDIDSTMAHHFYERNKGTLYRIPPKIKVRHIFIKNSDQALGFVREIHQQIIKSPEKFAELAKKHSQDAKTASHGGITDFFIKGTYDKEFEQAAFRLKEIGTISKVVKVVDGYEIIELVDRIKANEKPFDLVEEEIIKTLKARRAQAAIRSELENVVREFSEDEQVLTKFKKQNSLKEFQTEWLTENDAKKQSLDGILAKKIFSSNKRNSNIGFFTFEDSHVLYQSVDVEKSYIPSFEQIKNKIHEDWYAEQADALAKNILKQIRIDVLEKKISFSEAIEKFSGTLSVSKKSTKSESGRVLDSIEAVLRDKLFTLTDASQILMHKNGDKFYLAVLEDVTHNENASFDKEYIKIFKQESRKIDSLQSTAFIASLRRNAKIDIDRKMLENKPTDMKD